MPLPGVRSVPSMIVPGGWYFCVGSITSTADST